MEWLKTDLMPVVGLLPMFYLLVWCIIGILRDMYFHLWGIHPLIREAMNVPREIWGKLESGNGYAVVLAGGRLFTISLSNGLHSSIVITISHPEEDSFDGMQSYTERFKVSLPSRTYRGGYFARLWSDAGRAYAQNVDNGQEVAEYYGKGNWIQDPSGVGSLSCYHIGANPNCATNLRVVSTGGGVRYSLTSCSGSVLHLSHDGEGPLAWLVENM